jgi:hypothetical protein
VRVRFEGSFKPQWFHNDHFKDCVFACDLTAELLALNGNQQEGSLFAEHPQPDPLN